MYDFISAVQVGPGKQHRFFDLTVLSLKWIFLSLPGDSKDSVRVKKLLAGEGDCNCVKEFLGWTVDMETGTLSLMERKLWGLLTFLGIPETHFRIF